MIKTNIISLLFILPISIWCQDTFFSPIDIIQPLAAYRSKILEENPKAIDQLEVLFKKWEDLSSEPDEELFELIYHSLYFKNQFNDSLAQIYKYMSRKYNAAVLKFGIDEPDIGVILDCGQFFDLIIENVVSSEYPYVLIKPDDLYRELNFYEINKGHKVGELGAGSGFFSLFLGMICKEIDITINEIDKYMVGYIQTRIFDNAMLLDTSRIKAIDGSKSDTRLAENTYDRIIIRNAYHHFSKKKKMLSSIKEALKPKGKLCLYEPILEGQEADGHNCRLILGKETMIASITDSGFKLVKEEKMGSFVLLMFEM